MNDLIVSQRIRKRHHSFRPFSSTRKPGADTVKSQRGPRSVRPPLLSGLRRLKLPSLDIDFKKKVPVKPIAIGCAVLALLAAGSAAVAGAAASARLAMLESAADPAYEREMRSYTGLKQIETAESQDEKPPLDLAETFTFESYTVRPGDSLSSIAARNSLSIGSIVAANGIRSAKRVQVGTVLKIPNMDGLMYKVRKGDSLSRIASANGIPMEAILDANDLYSEDIFPGMDLFLPGARMSGMDLRQVLGDLFSYPIRGVLTSTYGWRDDPFTGVRRFHAAIDLAAPIGTPIGAAMDGRVSVVGYNSVYGKYVILTHDGGYQTWYAHMSEYRSERGQYVRQGQRIGEVGSTGYSTGSHVHFAVFKNGRALNPLTLLPSR